MSKIKRDSLSEEIALMRMCIEARFNACRTDAELVEQAPFINAQMLVLEKLIKTEAAIQRERIRAIDSVMKSVGDVASELVNVVIGQVNLSDADIKKTAKAVLTEIRKRRSR